MVPTENWRNPTSLQTQVRAAKLYDYYIDNGLDIIASDISKQLEVRFYVQSLYDPRIREKIKQNTNFPKCTLKEAYLASVDAEAQNHKIKDSVHG